MKIFFKKKVFQLRPFRETVKYLSIKNRLKRPLKVTIEITNACNSDCIMCPRQSMTRPVKNMDFELYKKIIDDCGKAGVKIVQPFNFGEPLMHNRLGEFIRYAKENTKSRVQISTNAALLTNEKAVELLDSGLDRINIDIDGFTKDTFEKVRKNLDFDRVVENTERFIELKKRLNKRIFITVSIINMDETSGEIAEFKRYWKPRVDRVLDVQYNTWIGSVPPFPPPLNKGGAGGIKRFNCPCKMLWDQMVILQDGRVALCCLDYDGKVIVGDMKNESILNIWNGNILNTLRQKQIELKFDEISTCRACNQYIYMERTQWQYMWGGF
ncbi:MAG: radical SAM protein [Nitrospinae bacterium]|nr:radical SAM protein [Nitrospinota bacterium]